MNFLPDGPAGPSFSRFFSYSPRLCFPFDFSRMKQPSGVQNHFFIGSLSVAHYQDFAENVLLFIPFGFGLACLACKKRQQNILILIGSLLAGPCVFFTVELLQVFLPTRDPSWTDVAANSIGSAIGCLAFRFMAVPSLEALVKLESKVEVFLSPR